ncbi:MAG: SDR family NAD(P)-dependent oxidoreductase, partial [Sphingobacteriia bacterium]
MKIVITGASKGIGKAIAAAFAAEGHALYLCSRGQKALYDTVAELQTQYPNALVKGRPA